MLSFPTTPGATALTKGRAFERIIRLERFATKDQAKMRAAQIAEEIAAERG